jgi:hypothetical protein
VRAVVFAGPSLPASAAPAVNGLVWRPPVRQGDVYEAALARPQIIGIVDGYFEVVPTVWHKEILWALRQGIHVYGAASIGALRAAELDDFGMHGVGDIYRQFRTGALPDDDEVAVLHGPEELGYPQLTEAMVNIRATLDRAVALDVMNAAAAARIGAVAKRLFYKERTYDAVLAAAAGDGVPPEVVASVAAWLPTGRVDRKRLDALELVDAVAAHLARGARPFTPTFDFAHTYAWEEARRRAGAREPISGEEEEADPRR